MSSGAAPIRAPRTIVVGGGIAGLATSVLLARDGHRVTLFERGDELGGRAATEHRAGFRFELGPSWYLMPRVFDRFFRLAGTSTAEQLDLVALDPGYRVFSEPRATGARAEVVTVPHGRRGVAELFERLEPGSSAALERYLDSAATTTELAERYFLYNPFTRLRSLLAPDVLKRLPRLLGLLATPLERFAAARFEHPVIRQILGYPAVFLGTSPDAAPAIYHMMSQLDLDEGVQYPLGGFTALVERLEALAIEAGVRIRTGAEVEQILVEPASPRRSRRPHAARGVRWRDAEGATHTAMAERVVSAADLHHTENALLAPEHRSYPERWWRRRVSGPGAVLITLGIRGELPQLPHHSLFFARDWRANFGAIFGDAPSIPDPASLYVCKPSETDPSVAPDGCENLFVLVPVPADPSLGAHGEDDPDLMRTAETAIDRIADWADIPDLRRRIVSRRVIGPADFANRYHSWRGGMLGPAHVLGQSAMFRAQNESKRVSGLYYAGATTAPGVGVPMCLISAELVLKRIRGDHSPGPTTI